MRTMFRPGPLPARVFLGQAGSLPFPQIPPGFDPLTYKAKTSPKTASPGAGCVFVSHSSPEIAWQDENINAFASAGWKLRQIATGLEFDVWACPPVQPGSTAAAAPASAKPAGTITVPIINQDLPPSIVGVPTKTVLIGGAVVLGGLVLLQIL